MSARPRRRALRRLALLTLLLVACRRDGAEAGASDAGPAEAAASAAVMTGAELVTANCLSCHGEEMLRQQRLPRERWAAVVKKMSTWGSPIEPEHSERLIDHLAASYGPDAGTFQPAVVDPIAAASELEPTPDGPLGGGDASRGQAAFAQRCATCHGPDARGQLGVSLVDRPLLHRAASFASVVRAGRGRMPGQPLRDDEVADVLAHLRRLR